MMLRIKFRTLYKGNLGRKIMQSSGKMRINQRVKKKKKTDHGYMCIICCNLGNARHILVVPNIFKKIRFYSLSRLFHSFLVVSR